MIRPRRAVATLVALAALGALAGCGPDSASSAKAGTCLDATGAPPPSHPSASAGSATSATPPPSPAGTTPGAANPTPAPTDTAPSASGNPSVPGNVASAQTALTKLPAVSLACFDGTGDVRVATLGRPAVVNLWASWCGPCRAELPGIEQFARSGVVSVIGVDTADTRGGAAPVIDDLGLTYPMVTDPDKKLANAIGLSLLPITLFVDAHGAVRYVYASGTPLTRDSLSRLVAEHLGVGG